MATPEAPVQYCFFGSGLGGDLAQLRSEEARLMQAAKAPITFKAYTAAWEFRLY
jgi:hypothetical protein